MREVQCGQDQDLKTPGGPRHFCQLQEEKKIKPSCFRQGKEERNHSEIDQTTLIFLARLPWGETKVTEPDWSGEGEIATPATPAILSDLSGNMGTWGCVCVGGGRWRRGELRNVVKFTIRGKGSVKKKKKD